MLLDQLLLSIEAPAGTKTRLDLPVLPFTDPSTIDQVRTGGKTSSMPLLENRMLYELREFLTISCKDFLGIFTVVFFRQVILGLVDTKEFSRDKI